MGLLQKFFDLNKNGKKLKVAVVGDSMVDEYYYVNVKKISPEFPIPVMHSANDRPTCSLPGGAANVAYQFKNFNAEVSLFTLADPAALSIFNKFGIGTFSSVALPYDNTPRKRRFYSDSHPTYRWDIEEKNYNLSDRELKEYQEALFYNLNGYAKDFDVIIFSDYDKGVFVNAKSTDFRQKDIFSLVDPKGKDIEKWAGCSILKPNISEARGFTGLRDPEEMCKKLRDIVKCWSVIITNAGEGVCGYCQNGSSFSYKPDRELEATSVIGAGDCFMSVLAMACSRLFTLEEAAEIAFQAGSLYVKNIHNEPIHPLQLLAIEDPFSAKIVDAEFIAQLKGDISFTNGVFDILHAGHLDTLRFAKSKGDLLVVGVNSDSSTARLKPGRPYVDLANRMKMIAAIECVDYVVSFDEDTPLELIKKIKPASLVKGGDYNAETIVGASEVKNVYVAPLVAGLSTTNLVDKVRRST